MISYFVLGDGGQKQDFISTLLAIGVFAIYSPAEVLFTAQLQYPIINLMTRALQSDKDLVSVTVWGAVSFCLTAN